MSNTKKFLITSVSSEVIILHSAGGDVASGRCPLCGAEVTNLPADDETKPSELPPSPQKADDPTKQTH